jgi:hypothetical protein
MRGRKFSGRYHIIASNASLHTDYTLHFEFSTKSVRAFFQRFFFDFLLMTI